MKRKKVVIVLPAYNAEKTLLKTYRDIPYQYRKNIILVDDSSADKTVKIAKKLGLKVFVHKKNLGYGGNQKTCYKNALKLNPDIIIMIHPDYQYDPKLIPALVAMIESGNYDVVLGSRILGGGALRGGMPLYKYISNRFLTFFENLCTGIKLSEYHTGLRAYKAEVLKNVNFQKNSNDFVFDNQILLQIIAKNYRIGEISCPTKYFKEASSINFLRSLKYGTGCIYWSIIYFLGRLKIYHHPLIFRH